MTPSCTKCGNPTVYLCTWDGETSYRCPECRAEYWLLPSGQIAEYPRPRKPGRAGRVH